MSVLHKRQLQQSVGRCTENQKKFDAAKKLRDEAICGLQEEHATLQGEHTAALELFRLEQEQVSSPA